mgnify:CR=1 FL=1
MSDFKVLGIDKAREIGRIFNSSAGNGALIEDVIGGHSPQRMRRREKLLKIEKYRRSGYLLSVRVFLLSSCPLNKLIERGDGNLSGIPSPGFRDLIQLSNQI